MVTGAGHTNEIRGIVATPDRAYSLGLDKCLRTFQPATNEFEYVTTHFSDGRVTYVSP